MPTVTRREFLVGTVSLGAAAAIAPIVKNFYRPSPNKLFAYLNNYRSDDILLTLGPIEMQPPSAPSWNEFLKMQNAGALDESTLTRNLKNYEIKKTQLSDPMPDYLWSDAWAARYSSAARAFLFLFNLTININAIQPSSTGILTFTEAPFPTDSSKFVTARNLDDVNILQELIILNKVALDIEIVTDPVQF